MTAVEHKKEQRYTKQPLVNSWYEGVIGKSQENDDIIVSTRLEQEEHLYNLNLTFSAEDIQFYKILSRYISQKVVIMFSESELGQEEDVFSLEINILGGNGKIIEKCMCPEVKYSSIT